MRRSTCQTMRWSCAACRWGLLSPNTARWLDADIPQCHEAKSACCQHAHEDPKRCSDLLKQANATCSSSFQANCWHLETALSAQLACLCRT